MPPVSFLQDFATALNDVNYTFFAVAMIFIVFDIVTGIMKGASQHKVSSSIMRQGFWHKLAEIAALLLALLVDSAMDMGIDLGFNAPIFEAACVYVMLMELASILENIKATNPKLADSRLLGIFGVGHDDDTAIKTND